MATYKVIQDIEAEDKLLGPLTLRQFIFAMIAAVLLYLTYFAGTHHAPFLAVVFVPTAAVSAFFAFPWGRDQPTEIWALAKIRFLLKPRRRIWDQSGIKQLVEITAPKQVITNFSNGLSPVEVKSRLRALADTIDSRGWAIKNAALNTYIQPALVLQDPTSDRLMGAISLPKDVDSLGIADADDMLDEQHNPIAQHVDSMINASSQARRQKLVNTLGSNGNDASQAPKPNNYWFLNQPAASGSIPNNMVTFNTQVVTPGAEQAGQAAQVLPAQSESELVRELDAKKKQMPGAAYYGHLHTIQPLSAQPAAGAAAPPALTPVPLPAQQMAAAASTTPTNPPAAAPAPSVTPAQQAAILNLSRNDDLNVATLAREAKRAGPPDEVVIKLH